MIESLDIQMESLNLNTIDSPSQVNKNESSNSKTAIDSTSQVNKNESSNSNTAIDSTSQVNKNESSNSNTAIDSTSQVNKNESSNSNTAIDSTSQVNKNESSSSNTAIDSPSQVNKNESSNSNTAIDSTSQVNKNESSSSNTAIDSPSQVNKNESSNSNTAINSTSTSTTPSLAVQKRLDYCAKIIAIAIAKVVAKSNIKSVNIVDLMQKDMNSIIELFEDIIYVSSNEDSKNEIIKKYPELVSLIRKETQRLLKHLNELLEECNGATVMDSIDILSAFTTPEEEKIQPNSTFDTNNNDSSKKEALVENGVHRSEGSVELLIDLD